VSSNLQLQIAQIFLPHLPSFLVIASFFVLVRTTKAKAGSSYGKSQSSPQNGSKPLYESPEDSTVRKRTSNLAS
jgi:hypothetical protein